MLIMEWVGVLILRWGTRLGCCPPSRRLSLVVNWELNHKDLTWIMESTTHSPTKVKSTDDKTLAKAKVARGIPLRACVARAAGWTFEKADASSPQEGNINKTSWLWVSWTHWDGNYVQCYYKFWCNTCDSQTITRTRTLKGGGFGLTQTFRG